MRATTKENTTGTYQVLVDGKILATNLPKHQALNLVLAFNEIEAENKMLKAERRNMLESVTGDFINRRI